MEFRIAAVSQNPGRVWLRLPDEERRADGAMAAGQGGTFKGRHFTAEVILWAPHWYLACPISYRDLAAMLSDRGISIDHTARLRWVQGDQDAQAALANTVGLSRISAGNRDAVFCPGDLGPLRDMPARPTALPSSEESL